MTEKEMPIELENQPEQEIIEPVEQVIHSVEELIANKPLEEEVNKLTTELKELQDKYLRLLAEFDNYKHRRNREFAELIKTASKEIIEQLLPVLDDFERAFAAFKGNSEEVEGFRLIQHILLRRLAAKGLKPMESKGTPFDPDLHEAIAKIPAPTDEQKGMVIDDVEKGYYLNDKIIRYAKVVVGE